MSESQNIITAFLTLLTNHHSLLSVLQFQSEQLLVSFLTKCDDHITSLPAAHNSFVKGSTFDLALVAFLLSFDSVKCKVNGVVADAAWPLNDHPCEEGAQATQLAGFLDEPAKRYNRLLRVHRIQADHELLDALD